MDPERAAAGADRMRPQLQADHESIAISPPTMECVLNVICVLRMYERMSEKTFTK